MIVLDLDDPRWVEFVERCAGATPFHHPSWARLIAQCYRYRAFALARPDAHGQIVAGLPVIEVGGRHRRRRWVSLPFTDHCPPLQQSTEAGAAGLAEELDATCREAGIAQLEVRDDLAGPGAHAGPRAVTHCLRLDRDPAAVYSRFKRPVRRGIEQAGDGDTVVRHDTSRRGLTDTFYRLHVQTRRRLGIPVQPRRYFDLLWRHMIAPGRGFVVHVDYEGTPIAGAVFLAWRGTVTYKYGASDARFWSLRPNHLVLWAAVRWACEHGYDTFDFGRSDLGSTGLRRFKSGWGEEHGLAYTTIGAGAALPANERLAKLGGAVIRRSPLWVCRLAGELLYRYAA